jgi:Leucine-rich repeat (LRR) protein
VNEDLAKISTFFLDGTTMLTDDERRAGEAIDLSMIGRMVNLKYLTIRHIKVKDYSFLTSLKQLQSLEVSGFKMNEIPIDQLSQMNQLTYISLTEGDLSSLEGLKPLSKSLQNLDISYFRQSY